MAVLSTIFWVYGMTRPGNEPRSPGQLANILLIRPMAWLTVITNFNELILHFFLLWWFFSYLSSYFFTTSSGNIPSVSDWLTIV